MENRKLHTKDGVPLDELLGEVQETIELYNRAPKVLRDLLGQNVSDQEFTAYIGDMPWEELAEGEHPRTGELAQKRMGFAVKTFGRSLGFTRQALEDNSADYFRRRIDSMIRGALDKEHEVILETVRNGWADGSQLWFTPAPHGAKTFTDTHNHDFVDTAGLFGDANAYSAVDHLVMLRDEVTEHNKAADIAIVGDGFARALKAEVTWGAQYVIPGFESLYTTEFPDNGLEVEGLRVYKSSWLPSDEVHVVASSERPLYFHERRPVEVTEGEAGGPVGDNGTLLGAYGSARYGAVVPDPLNGAVCRAADNIAA